MKTYKEYLFTEDEYRSMEKKLPKFKAELKSHLKEFLHDYFKINLDEVNFEIKFTNRQSEKPCLLKTRINSDTNEIISSTMYISSYEMRVALLTDNMERIYRFLRHEAVHLAFFIIGVVERGEISTDTDSTFENTLKAVGAASSSVNVIDNEDIELGVFMCNVIKVEGPTTNEYSPEKYTVTRPNYLANISDTGEEVNVSSAGVLVVTDIESTDIIDVNEIFIKLIK